VNGGPEPPQLSSLVVDFFVLVLFGADIAPDVDAAADISESSKYLIDLNDAGRLLDRAGCFCCI
jgi:hypothetical protein